MNALTTGLSALEELQVYDYLSYWVTISLTSLGKMKKRMPE
jgi:hypothetical protein